MTGNKSVGGTRTTAQRRLADDEGAVTVRKLVSKGERLEIASDDESVKLDALLLEGLSWQRDPAAIDDRIEGDTAVADDPAAAAGDDVTPVTAETPDAIPVSSEYSQVFVADVPTDAGDALVVTTPGRGSTVRLGVPSLRALAAVEDTYAFSVWFRTPFGPEDTPVEGPL